MAESLLGLIKADIQKHLPSDVEEHIVDTVAEQIVKDGCRSISELQFVTLDDISPYLSKHDARRLLSAWGKKSNSQVDETNRPSTSSTSGILQAAPLRHSNDKFDYKKLPDNILDCLNKKKALNNKQMDKVVECVVENVTFSVPGVQRKFFGSLSKDIVQDYPESFQEINVGSKSRSFKNTAEKLCYKLKNRFDNCNRSAKTDKQKEAPNRPEAYGCVKWRVLSLPPDSTQEELDQLAEDMRTCYNTQKKNTYDWEDIKRKLTKTYGMQRGLIIAQINYAHKKNKPTKENEGSGEEDEDEEEENVTTSSIQDKFPMLFTYKGMIHHFEILTEKNFETLLSEWLGGVEDILVDFLAIGKPKNLKIKAELQKQKKRGDRDNEEYELIAIFLMLANYFNDDLDLLVQCVEVGTKIYEVNTQATIPPTPCIFAVGKSKKTKKSII